MFSYFRPWRSLHFFIALSLILSVIAGQLTSFLVNRNQTNAIFRSVMNATFFQEKSSNFDSHLRLLFSSLQLSDDPGSESSDRLAVALCRDGQIVASAPRWIRSTISFDCDKTASNSLWKFELRETLPFSDQPTLAIVHRELSPWNPYAIITTLFLWLITGACALWSTRLAIERKRLVSVLERLEESLLSGERSAKSLSSPKIAGWSSQAGKIFEQRVVALKTMIESAQKKYACAQSEAEVGKIAQHAAHDIRSPLTVIDFVSRNLSQLPESERVLLRRAIQRFREIADDLLYLGRNRGGPTQDVARRADVHSLQGIVQEIVSEKIVQFKSATGLRISMKTDPAQYGKFVSIDASSFKRVLSNVINNASEAMKFKGSITISIFESASGPLPSLVVRVSDNGPGIPASLLQQLGKVKVSLGKKDGLGLGLVHAKEVLSSWKGDLKISSTEGQGTHVDLEIPEASPPDWFCLEVRVPAGLSVVILDDDPLIHSIWDRRFSKSCAPLHFFNGEDFSRWVSFEANKSKDTLFLLDLELARESATGMDLIERHQLGPAAVVVSSQYEDSSLIDRCIQQGCRLLPKPLAPVVPIRFSFVPGLVTDKIVDTNCEAVLVDDEDDIREIWTMYAGETGKKLRTFARAEEFLQVAQGFRRDIPIYLDASLRGGMPGLEAAKALRSLGFTNIGLATGFPKDKFQPVPWIDFISDKRPPWSLDGDPGARTQI